MPDVAAVWYNCTNMKVAPLLANGTYGGPVALDIGSEMQFAFENDTDELFSYGMVVERLSITVRVTGQFMQGSLDSVALWVMTGVNTVSSGSQPNRIADSEILAGGSGLPYFGLMGEFAATNGANGWAFLRKIQLETIPEYKIERNKFRISEVKFAGMAKDTSGRKLVKIRQNETLATLPDFNAYA